MSSRLWLHLQVGSLSTFFEYGERLADFRQFLKARGQGGKSLKLSSFPEKLHDTARSESNAPSHLRGGAEECACASIVQDLRG